MAANWDSDDATTTTTTTNNNNNTNKTQQKKKRKRKKKNKNKNKNKQAQQPKPQPIPKKHDTWSDTDDEETKQQPKKEEKQPRILEAESSNKPSKNKPKDKNNKKIKSTTDSKTLETKLDDDSNDDNDDDDTPIDDKKSKGLYPIWRPEQNYKYNPKNYDYEPNFIQRDEILLKVKRKQTFIDAISAFEEKHGIENIFSNVELLEIYGINIYNNFTPIYENIGDDNHRPFMIDFDSLLLDIFHSPLISSQLKYGPRLLPIIYILDNYLDLLFCGGRSVQIIIFKCNKNLWKYEIHYYLREYIKYYLFNYWQQKQQNKYSIKYPLVFEFESFWNDNFSNYIYQYLPVFALIVRPDFSTFIVPENRFLFIYETFYLISLRIPCVQSTEITFSSNALYGFTIDIPHNIEKYILNKFRLTQSSSKPIKLKPLLSLKPINKIKTPIFNNDVITNLNFINNIANDKIHIDKPNIRRLSCIYSLISMFRNNDNITPFQWDFIRLILLQLIISENEDIKNKCRSQMLPKINIATAPPQTNKKDENNKDQNNKPKPKTVSWLEYLDSEDDDDDDDADDSDDIDQEEKKKEEERKKKEAKKKKEKVYDLDLIIRECWWYKINKLKDNLNTFMIHCTVFLSENKTDESNNNNFDCKSFCDCFDFRIFCYLLSIHNRLIGGTNKKRKNLPCKFLENEKRIINNIGLTKENLRELLELYNIIKSEIGCENQNLYPIIQSKYLLNISFKKDEFNDSNLSIFQSDPIRAGYVRIEGDIINILMGDLEREFSERGLLYATKRVSYYKQRKDFFRKYDWVSGGIIPDGIKPYVYEHRNYMIFQTFIQKYAQSLEGGKVVLRDVIVAKKKEDNTVEKKEDDIDNKKYKHKQKGKQILRKRVEDVRKAAALAVQKREREKKLERVGNLIRICTTMYKDLESRIARLDLELEEENDPIAALPGLTKLHEWATQSALKSNIERNIYPVVRLWQITFDIFRRFIENNIDEDLLPSIELIHQLQKSLHLMGFKQPAAGIANIYCSKCTRYSLHEVLIPFNSDNIRISIGLSYSRFQMEHCGAYMIRGVGSRPDPRVTGFYPDEWQVKLLDIVDKRYSGLIVAPTSSGKTFVSYYCMKEILQANKSIKNQTQKGIVIYVSPTKALTWQACADIYSKYGDVFGVLTPDYDHKPLECQVLVCVPESFEKLLMSAQRIQLHKQIKYVIFDEIHCLGRSEGGAIWERLLMLIRSPFLALSATVGHPLALKKWLNTITNVLQLRTDKYKHKVRIIQHKERWSYLDKHIYLPDQNHAINDKQNDLYIGCHALNIGWKSSIRKIHPVGAIGLTINNNILDVYDGFPPLTFSPSDCITLYDSMCKYIDEIEDVNYKRRLLLLKPDEFFKLNLYITKNQASKYEKLLKKELKSWIVGYNRKSLQIDIEQDIADDSHDEIDELLIYEPEIITVVKNENKNQKLSKKEKKRLQQLKRQQEREKQRQEREKRRQFEREKRKNKNKIKIQKKEIIKKKKKEIIIKKEEKKEFDNNNIILEEEILSHSEKQKRRIIVDKLLNSMASNTLLRIGRMEEIQSHGMNGNDCYSFEWVKLNFINLVIELESTDRLPTLCFVLDRVACEELFLKLLSDLEYLEDKKKQFEMGQMNNKEMEIERRRREKARQKLLKKQAKLRETKNRQKKNEDENPELHDGLDEFDDGAANRNNKKDYRFALFNRGDEMDSDDLKFWTRRLLKKTKWPATHPLMRGLERGIGLHHEGLPLQYRQLVETLFRAKHIKLVVSVASLAMGVNMPARCVVFAGDSFQLDPLNYRQMMGRAGRRGYDNIGHVIFFGISPRKISYLMTSQLTSLNGHYPIISITSSIRSCKLLYTSIRDEDCDAQYYIGLIKNLFHKPFNYKIPKNDIMNGQIINKFRYSLDYHIQNGLLSIQDLNIDCLGDLAAVLHEYEPNNLLFIQLLQCGYFHKICKGYTKLKGDHNSKLKKDILCKILLILTNIFQLHPIPISYIPKPNRGNNYLNRSYLSLPIAQLDLEILQIIDKYRYNFISHYYNLYFKYSSSNQNIQHIFGKENIINYIKYYLKYCDGGTFGHNQIFLQDFRGRNMYKNSYIYDFYLHEDYKRIVDESSLRDGLAWKKLKKFQLLLSIINKSLNHISSLKSKQDLINEEVKEKIEQFENSLQKLRQHRFSVYRRQQQFWMDPDGKLWKKYEIQQKKDNLKLQAIGDDFVMAFQDLNKDFNHKFRNINIIGPIASYDTFMNNQNTENNNTTTNTIPENNNTATTTISEKGASKKQQQQQQQQQNNNNNNNNNTNTTTEKE